MTGEVESGTPEQVTIMVVTTAIEFACGFGLIALVIWGLIETFYGQLSIKEVIGLPLCFGLTMLTGYRAMMLICRPTRNGMIGLLLMCAATIGVAVGMIA